MTSGFCKGFADATYIDQLLNAPSELRVINDRVRLAIKRKDQDWPTSLYLPTSYGLGVIAYKWTAETLDYIGRKFGFGAE